MSLADHALILDRGEGVWLWDVHGNRYLDALSSLWNVNAGHGRRELADAAAEQMARLAFNNSYTGFANEPSIRLAKRLVELQDRMNASKALQALGKKAEKAVAGCLSHAEWTVRLEACKILAVVGTRASKQALDKASRDTNGLVAREAKRAAAAAAGRP